MDPEIKTNTVDAEVVITEKQPEPPPYSPAQYPQTDGCLQPQGYPQPGVYPQPQGYPQPGVYPQPKGYPQPGVYPQPQGYPQPGVYPQPQGYPQPGVYPQLQGVPPPVGYPQPYPQPEVISLQPCDQSKGNIEKAKEGSNLVPAILVTLFCCLPLGIVAIVKSSEANRQLASGNVAEGVASNRSAMKFIKLAFFIGLICNVILILIKFVF